MAYPRHPERTSPHGYSTKLGVPVAMVNKVGRSYKPPPNEINGVFPGRSAIVDSDGAVLQSMDDKEGIGIANIGRLRASEEIAAPARASKTGSSWLPSQLKN